MWRAETKLADFPRGFGGREVVLRGDLFEASHTYHHGELIRAGYDERMEVAPRNLQFLFQGLADEDWGNQYGRLGWRLGLLDAAVE